MGTCAEPSPSPRDFFAALKGDGRSRGARLIAEIKRASPSMGIIDPAIDAAERAATFAAAGASAISVLTEPRRFRGSLDDLAAARSACGIPLLRKDFIVEPSQVQEAAQAGADAVLLIVSCLDGPRLKELAGLAGRLGLAALVEVHDESEIELAVAAGARIIGVNNRSLETLRVDPGTIARLAPLLPEDVVRVAESGFENREQVRRAEDLGYHAVLVGTALSRAKDPAAKVRELLGR